ncbi:hypothetical protein [Staphylococcus carnosus]|nr:hypothetical protein [Staphylococcus carnosus]
MLISTDIETFVYMKVLMLNSNEDSSNDRGFDIGFTELRHDYPL